MISNPENCSVKQEMSIIFIYEKINTLRSYLLKVTQQAKSQSLHKILPTHPKSTDEWLSEPVLSLASMHILINDFIKDEDACLSNSNRTRKWEE